VTPKRLCVFCGSNSGRSPALAEAARGLGRLLALQRIGLVYGGGRVGLMGILADAALAEGGEVLGVIPRQLVDRELAHQGVTALYAVDTMHDRKQKMHDLSDAFVALPGGFGTLDELFEVLTWAQLGMHDKPCALLDVEGFWQPLLALVEHQVTEGLVAPRHARLLQVARSPAELLVTLFAPTPPSLG
jgi:uncharacterized protein (TIGR00730 family)